MRVVFVGPDRGLATALEGRGSDVERLTGVTDGAALDAARVETADLLVLTDVAEATVVPIAKERNPDLRIVVYAPDSLPEFVRGQVDIAVSPALLDAAVVAEELAEPA